MSPVVRCTDTERSDNSYVKIGKTNANGLTHTRANNSRRTIIIFIENVGYRCGQQRNIAPSIMALWRQNRKRARDNASDKRKSAVADEFRESRRFIRALRPISLRVDRVVVRVCITFPRLAARECRPSLSVCQKWSTKPVGKNRKYVNPTTFYAKTTQFF